MIRLLRVDDSFLYGKNGLLWTGKLNAKVIVIIDNGLKRDHFAQNMLQLACPESVTLVILDGQEAIDRLPSYGKSRESVIAVIGSFVQALQLFPSLEGISRISVGSVRGNTARELMAFQELIEKGVEFEIQDLPDDRPLQITVKL